MHKKQYELNEENESLRFVGRINIIKSRMWHLHVCVDAIEKQTHADIRAISAYTSESEEKVDQQYWLEKYQKNTFHTSWSDEIHAKISHTFIWSIS